jgi:peptidoglycan-associated lipoprotein
VELPQGTRQSARVPANRSIYFDFDEYAIGPDGQTVVLANADYLTRNTSARAVIEGSADERGSREYNLALGQRRAEAVRKALASQGVAASRLEAVSIGEERPRNPGHDDAAWAENRRADIQFR